MKYLFILALSITSTYIFGQKPNLEKKVNEFDAYVGRVMQEWEVPGMSIVVVKDGKVLFKKAYGVRELGRLIAWIHKPYFPVHQPQKQ